MLWPPMRAKLAEEPDIPDCAATAKKEKNLELLELDWTFFQNRSSLVNKASPAMLDHRLGIFLSLIITQGA
ncbi:hypothetical protein Thiowin_02810 [Thiorhodovibrio winogradskyi]|uniref:Transposase n=1 Tax=Thiorhodovibrio winogradskyi TaxID=77007 RepID=A0ABZ0SB75_9GAMM